MTSRFRPVDARFASAIGALNGAMSDTPDRPVPSSLDPYRQGIADALLERPYHERLGYTTRDRLAYHDGFQLALVEPHLFAHDHWTWPR